MSKETARSHISKPADEIWMKIGDFSDLWWHTGVETCTTSKDVRTVKMHGMDFKVVERLTLMDNQRRSYAYEIIDYLGDSVFQFPDGTRFDLLTTAGHHRATISVTPNDDETSLITYECEMDDGYDALILGTTSNYQSHLDELKHILEK